MAAARGLCSCLLTAGLALAAISLQATQTAAEDLSKQVGKTHLVCGVVTGTRKVKDLTYLDLEGKVSDQTLSVAVELKPLLPDDTFESVVRRRAVGLRICGAGKIRKEPAGFVVKLDGPNKLRSGVLPTDPPSGFFGDAFLKMADVPNAVNPRERKFAEPKYTSAAMRAGVVGMVVMECAVRIDGTTGGCRVTKSLDALYGLDEQALAAVKGWTFYPAQKDGEPIPVVVTLEVVFKLH